MAALLLAVAGMPLAPAQAQTVVTLVGNVGQTSEPGLYAADDVVQVFTAGSNEAGYTLSAVGIVVKDDTTFSLSLCEFTSRLQLASCVTLTPPGTFAAGTLTFTAPANTSLAKGQKYALRATAANMSFSVTESNAESPQLTGWSIDDDVRLLQTVTDTFWHLSGADDSLQIAIKGSVNNNPPTSENSSVKMGQDTTYTFAAEDFPFSDSDAGDELHSVKITTLESAGELKLGDAAVTLNQAITKADIDAGMLKFTPASGASGAGYATFQFKVNDGTDDSRSAATMTIDVIATLTTPVPAGHTAIFSTTLVVKPGHLFDEWYGYGSGFPGSMSTSTEFTWDQKYSLPRFFHASKQATIQFSLTPQPSDEVYSNWTLRIGEESIAFSDLSVGGGALGWRDDDLWSEANSPFFDGASIEVKITVPPNLAPTASDGRVDADRDGDYAFKAGDFKFEDPDGDALASVQVLSLPAEGKLTLDGSELTSSDLPKMVAKGKLDAGSLVYTPPPGAIGEGYASFTFKVSDGQADSVSASTMTIDVRVPNAAPTVTEPPRVKADQDEDYRFKAGDFNFSDPDGDELASVKVESLPASNRGKLEFDGTALTGDDLPKTVTKAQLDDGKLVYAPPAGESGDSYAGFSFTVYDGRDDSALSTMTIDVRAPNNAPTVEEPARVATDRDEAYTFEVDDFNFRDGDGDELHSVKITTLESAGELKLDNADVTQDQVIAKADIDAGKLTFTPAPGVTGVAYATFQFKVNDGRDDSESAYTMTIDVRAPNAAPTVEEPASVETDQDGAYTFKVDDFNFRDGDGDELHSVKITTLESAGELKLGDADVTLDQVIAKADIDAGKLTFTPASGATGAGYATFRFTVSDGRDDSESAYTMTIDVRANAAPTVAEPARVETFQDTDYAFKAGDFNFRDEDAGDELVSVKVTLLPASNRGTLEFDGDPLTGDDLPKTVARADLDAGKLVYAPPPGAIGASYTGFAFKVSDGKDDSEPYTMTIDVNPFVIADTIEIKSVTAMNCGRGGGSSPVGTRCGERTGDHPVHGVVRIHYWDPGARNKKLLDTRSVPAPEAFTVTVNGERVVRMHPRKPVAVASHKGWYPKGWVWLWLVRPLQPGDVVTVAYEPPTTGARLRTPEGAYLPAFAERRAYLNVRGPQSPVCRASDLGNQTLVWEGTVTAGDLGSGAVGYAGADGALDDKTITLGGIDYTVERVALAVSGADEGRLTLDLSRPIHNARFAGLQLHVCGASYSLDREATHTGGGAYVSPHTTVSWVPGERYTLRLARRSDPSLADFEMRYEDGPTNPHLREDVRLWPGFSPDNTGGIEEYDTDEYVGFVDSVLRRLVTMRAVPADPLSTLEYRLDNRVLTDADGEIEGFQVDLWQHDGTRHRLRVRVTAPDGRAQRTYRFQIRRPEADPAPKITNTGYRVCAHANDRGRGAGTKCGPVQGAEGAVHGMIRLLMSRNLLEEPVADGAFTVKIDGNPVELHSGTPVVIYNYARGYGQVHLWLADRPASARGMTFSYTPPGDPDDGAIRNTHGVPMAAVADRPADYADYVSRLREVRARTVTKSSEVRISWVAPPPEDGQQAPRGFALQVSTGGDWEPLAEVGDDVNEYIDDGLTGYIGERRYRVAGVTDDGAGAWSDPVSPLPAEFAADGVEVLRDGGSATVRVQVVNPDGSTVHGRYREAGRTAGSWESFSFVAGSDTETVSLSGLAPGAAYAVELDFSAAFDSTGSRRAAFGIEAAEQAGPFTASFRAAPEEHDGTAFVIELHFSENPPLGYRTLRDHALSVSGGVAKTVRRLDPDAAEPNRAWSIAIEPDGDGAVTVRLNPTAACTDTGAICLADGRRLAQGASASVSGPAQAPPPQAAPFTASFRDVPAEHDGTAFAFELHFSENPPLSFRTLRDHALAVTGGVVKKVRRLHRGAAEPNRAWSIAIEPAGIGEVTVRLNPTTGACTDPGAICLSDGRKLVSALSATVRGPAALSVADARANEGEDAIAFTVSLSRAAAGEVTVDYATRDGTAVAGEDYTATQGTLRFAAGQTEKTVPVPVLDDAIDEGSETFTLTLTNARGAAIGDGTATGTIENDDPLQAMWLARFGRTVADQVTAAVSDRLASPLSGAQVTVGGQTVNLAETEDHAALNQALTGLARVMGASRSPAPGDGPDDGTGTGGWPGTGLGVRDAPANAGTPGRVPEGRELLLGSAFHLAREGDGRAPGLAAWGRVTVGGFDGEAPADDGNVRIDGTVTTGILGADAAWDRLLAGVAVSVSEGEGTFDLPGIDKGSIESTMTTVSPYARFTVNDRLSVWGLAGWGTGDMTIVQDARPAANGQTARDRMVTRTDIAMRLAALGGRGALMQADEDGGIDLALRADAFYVETESDPVSNEGKTVANASRVRLALEGSRAFRMEGGGMFTPGLELGLRHDGGDAETGTGVELGGRVSYTDPETGLGVEARARVLVAHEDSDYREWGASGSVRLAPGERGRGLSFSLSPTWGAASSGVERLWSARDARGLAPEGGFEAAQRLEGELGYGLGLFGDRFTGTPNVGFGLSDKARDWRIGWRLTSAVRGDPGFEVNLDATRREAANSNAPAEHGVMLRAAVRW